MDMGSVANRPRLGCYSLARSRFSRPQLNEVVSGSEVG